MSNCIRLKSLQLQVELVESLLVQDGGEGELAEVLWEELAEPAPNFELVQKICHNETVLEKVKADGSLPIHIACFNKNCLISEKIINYLLDRSPKSLFHKNKFGLIPLHKAVCVCGERELKVVKMMVERGLSTLSCRTNDGHTPLHLALSAPKYVCRGLIEYMLSLNGQLVLVADLFGHLPLHKAVSRSKSDAEIVNLLLCASATSAGVKDFRGCLPLHWILSKREPNLDVLFLVAESYLEGLLEYDNNGCTPYMKYMQRKFRNLEVEQALLELTDLARETILENSRTVVTRCTSASSSAPTSRSAHYRPYRPLGKR